MSKNARARVYLRKEKNDEIERKGKIKKKNDELARVGNEVGVGARSTFSCVYPQYLHSRLCHFAMKTASPSPFYDAYIFVHSGSHIISTQFSLLLFPFFFFFFHLCFT